VYQNGKAGLEPRVPSCILRLVPALQLVRERSSRRGHERMYVGRQLPRLKALERREGPLVALAAHALSARLAFSSEEAVGAPQLLLLEVVEVVVVHIGIVHRGWDGVVVVRFVDGKHAGG